MKKRILLHCCCAPCASVCIERLTEKFEVALLYFNPNIPQPENAKRREELVRFNKETVYNLPILDEKQALPQKDFETSVRELQLENVPENGKRCDFCYTLRLKITAEFAEDFDFFATSLTLSPHKNAETINKIGAEISTKYLPTNFKKKDGYRRSLELSAEYSLYRQNYCGCVFSVR